MFALDQWYIAGFSNELSDKPLARTLLNKPLVLFRTGEGEVAALDDRCCHRSLPLSLGQIEQQGIRCGYHGLLYAPNGTCIEIPGQENIPSKCKVRSHRAVEQDQIVWVWFGAEEASEPSGPPPSYPWHSDARYEFKGDVFHYDAPYLLVHDNLLDLSHVGYVHRQTIGGDPKTHMQAQTTVTSDANRVRVVRHMKNAKPPATYSQSWPFAGNIDRWQEIEFHLSHLCIWTGAVDAGSESIENPGRGCFHMRGLHGVTPETDVSTHYFWTIASNRQPSGESNMMRVYEQTAATFYEDKVIVEAQFENMKRFNYGPQIDIHVDAGANRARRIIQRLAERERAEEAGG